MDDEDARVREIYFTSLCLDAECSYLNVNCSPTFLFVKRMYIFAETNFKEFNMSIIRNYLEIKRFYR